MPPSDAIPAATLIVMRERDGGTPEVLMVERARAMRFAGGALVFPGGRIDAGDHALAATLGGDADETAARIAAVRETIEEAGLAIGLDHMLDQDAIARLRRALYADGVPLAEALAAIGATIDPATLIPFARWLPPEMLSRVFDTRFYLARLPQGAAEAIVDGNENVRLFWATPQAVLDQADAGQVTIIYPTRRNLERLAQFASFEETAAHARTYPVRTITPWTERRGGIDHLCIPDDLGYPITSQPMIGAVRE